MADEPIAPDLLTPLPFAEPDELRPAKINDRFIAYLFDALPFMLGYYGFLYIATAKAGLDQGNLISDPRFIPGLASAWVLLYWIYQTLGNATGGTIGKRLLGIVAVTKEGEPLGFGRSLARGLGSILSTPLCNLGYIVALFHPESRALHDLIAGTLVVEKRTKQAAESWLTFAVAMAAIIGMFGGTLFLTIQAPTSRDLRAIAKAQQGLPILARIEDAYFNSHSAYTDSLADLAQASGDPEQFHAAMEGIFDLHHIEIQAGNRRYRIAVAARDRHRTLVTLEGP